MANNGILLADGSCVSVIDYGISYCKANYPAFLSSRLDTYSTSATSFNAFTSCKIGSSYLPIPAATAPFTSFSCAMQGPDLSSDQQIQAVNELVPLAVAVLVAAYAARFLRGLVEHWLQERNSGAN